MFDFVEESFDQIAFAVKCVVAIPLDGAVFLGWYDDICPGFRDEIDDGITVISLVSQHILRGDTCQ